MLKPPFPPLIFNFTAQNKLVASGEGSRPEETRVGLMKQGTELAEVSRLSLDTIAASEEQLVTEEPKLKARRLCQLLTFRSDHIKVCVDNRVLKFKIIHWSRNNSFLFAG